MKLDLDIQFPAAPGGPPAVPWRELRNEWGQSRGYSSELTSEALAAHRKALAAWEQAWAEYDQAARKVVEQAAQALQQAGFVRVRRETPKGKRREVEVHLSAELHRFAPIARKPWPPSLSAETAWLEKQQAAQRQAEQDQKRQAEEARAVRWLLARGKVYGEHFTSENAVKLAQELAFTEATERRAAELAESGSFMDFSGQNCEGPCAGWDGQGRRCDCGNRRVGWEMPDWYDFEKPDEGLHAEAW